MSGARGSREMIITVAARFGGKAVNLLVFMIVARHLQLEEMAVYGFVFSMGFILSVTLDLGLRNAAGYFIGKNADRAAAFASTAFVLLLALAVLALPATWAALAWDGSPEGMSAPMSPAIVLVIAMLGQRVLQGVLLGTGQLADFNTSELVGRVVLIVLTTIFALGDRFTLGEALWGLALSQAIGLGWLLWRLRPMLRAARPETALAVAMLRRGLPFMLSVLIMNLGKRFAFLAVSARADAELAGLFFALQRLTDIITEVGLAVAVVIFSRTVRAASPEAAVEDMARSSRICFVAFLFIALGLGVTAEWSVPLLLGAKFGGQNTLFHLILLATLAGSAWTVLSPSLAVVMSPVTSCLLFLPGLFLNIATITPLMDRFGVAGAAVSLLIANLVLSASFLLMFQSRFGVPVQRFLLPTGADFAPLLARARRA